MVRNYQPKRPVHAPMPSLNLPLGRKLPTLQEQEPQIAALLKPIGRTGLATHEVKKGKE